MTDSFAEKLSSRRSELDLTQRQLADLVGVSWSQISKYETGQSKPRRKVLVKLSEALKMDIADLAGPAERAAPPIDVRPTDDLSRMIFEDSSRRRHQLQQEMKELEESDLSDYDNRQTKLSIRVKDSNGGSRGYQVTPCLKMEGDFQANNHLQQILVDFFVDEVGDLAEVMRRTKLVEIYLTFEEPLSKKEKVKQILLSRRLAEL
ncbi:helix-turn-helix domain-containing protein [Pseudomonas leptonychotis]|uniref:helix-turn-helix domain-containing protein n=1 Tax=Pseudomonas leptonychotis TaxID=2448482 RepID=UPI00386621C9